MAKVSCSFEYLHFFKFISNSLVLIKFLKVLSTSIKYFHFFQVSCKMHLFGTSGDLVRWAPPLFISFFVYVTLMRRENSFFLGKILLLWVFGLLGVWSKGEKYLFVLEFLDLPKICWKFQSLYIIKIKFFRLYCSLYSKRLAINANDYVWLCMTL